MTLHYVMSYQGRIQDLIKGGPQIVTGLKLPFWGLSFVEFWCWGLIFGGWGGGAGPPGPPPGSAPAYICMRNIERSHHSHHVVGENFWIEKADFMLLRCTFGRTIDCFDCPFVLAVQSTNSANVKLDYLELLSFF